MSYCGGTSGVMLVMASGLKRPCCGIDQRDRAVEVAAVRDQRADNLARAGHLAAVDVAVGGVVAEDQLRVRAVGADRPERVAEVGPLVEILRARPEDAGRRASPSATTRSGWRYESGRMLLPSASMRNSTNACGRQHRNRALQRVEMNASPPSGSGHG